MVYGTGPCVGWFSQEASGKKLIGESLKDVGRLEPSQLLPLGNGIGGEDRDILFVFYFVHRCFL